MCSRVKLKEENKKEEEILSTPDNVTAIIILQFYKLNNELRSYPDKSFNYYLMSVNSFDDLLNIILNLIIMF